MENQFENLLRYLDKLIQLESVGYDVSDKVETVLTLIESGLTLESDEKSFDLGNYHAEIKLDEDSLAEFIEKVKVYLPKFLQMGFSEEEALRCIKNAMTLQKECSELLRQYEVTKRELEEWRPHAVRNLKKMTLEEFNKYICGLDGKVSLDDYSEIISAIQPILRNMGYSKEELTELFSLYLTRMDC